MGGTHRRLRDIEVNQWLWIMGKDRKFQIYNYRRGIEHMNVEWSPEPIHRSQWTGKDH
jgi:hypothetical protein